MGCSQTNQTLYLLNGQCVSNTIDCDLSLEQFPLCNGRGTCRSDGTCACSAEYKTFLVNEEYSLFISYPYTVNQVTKFTEPTAWIMNYNWRNHGLNQCTARNCDNDGCKVPKGCYTGTPDLDFLDKWVMCPNLINLCACVGLKFPGYNSFANV
jgi:hypothetical protein